MNEVWFAWGGGTTSNCVLVMKYPGAVSLSNHFPNGRCLRRWEALIRALELAKII